MTQNENNDLKIDNPESDSKEQQILDILYPLKFSAKLRKSQNQKERTSWHNENNGRPRRN